MRTVRTFYSLVLILFITSILSGQDRQEITLEQIYRSPEFTAQLPQGLESMNDGVHYTVLNRDRIEQYSYKTGDRVATLFDAAEFPEIPGLSGYALSKDEKKILLETGREQIYRHSFKADYHVFDRETGTVRKASPGGKQQLATFSPGGDKVAFVRENNLYITDLETQAERQVTFDGVKNQVINGIPDWVYEEEFGFSRGFYWSPDGTMLAFYRFDESRVREFSMTLFGELYPEITRFKYPKAGEMNSLVTIRVFNLVTGETTTMDTGGETDQYIPRIKWTAEPGVLSIMRLNRLQNRMDILHADVAGGASKVVYSETNNKYISEASDHTVTYIPDTHHFILLSEKSGYFHFYLFDYLTGELDPITSGEYDVDEFLGYDKREDRLYYTSCEISPLQRHVYSIRTDGTDRKQLTVRPGTNTAGFSKTFRYYVLTHSSANTPPYITLHNHRGKQIRILEDNSRLVTNTERYGFSPVEFLTIPTESGQELNAWMIKPPGFEPGQKYALFMYVYGGPESQNVTDSWGRRSAWFQLLAQRGYVVACVDNRGTDGRGEKFRKATYMSLGRLETTDQLESARWLGALDYIDQERMGIFGWSYGGFMTSLCMTRGNGLFAMGIAVAPVTNWRYYDTIYTERFMRTPQENPEGYDLNSPIHYASGLQGAFLLIHGTADDNVHFQNSVDFSEALVEADRQFEMQYYANKNHSIHGGNTSYHLYRKMTDFILENL